ncbi:hypothetical protein GCM10010339_47290 [Streptomyces alanosinicus]|uniref:MD-2-related lipid-recognition domain-containing protein n=1 Tax=Streptomyces alanosinicus TaxID=68171 RepID=A0A918YKN7_9ACTN|nr:hypothetical protein GCM10010339_47290 [Streptomyces alanosinicus]
MHEGAYVKVTVKYGLIRLISTTLDLGEQLKDHDAPVQLPVEAGQVSLPIYYGDFFANNTPPGTYSVFADAYTDDDEGLACVKATVTVPLP